MGQNNEGAANAAPSAERAERPNADDWKAMYDDEVRLNDRTLAKLMERDARVAALERVAAASADHGVCSCAAMTDGEGPRPIGGGRFYHYQGCDHDEELLAARALLAGDKAEAPRLDPAKFVCPVCGEHGGPHHPRTNP